MGCWIVFFFQAEDGIRDAQESRGLGDVYKRQLKSRYRKKTNRLREAENRGMPVHVIRSNTYIQVLHFVKDLFGLSDSFEKSGETGLIEAEKAARQVLRENEPIELTPRNAFVRRLQHKIAERYNLFSQSIGEEPFRRVTIYPRNLDDNR